MTKYHCFAAHYQPLKIQNERKIERRSKRFERERERKVLQKLSVSASANFPAERKRERSQFFLAH